MPARQLRPATVRPLRAKTMALNHLAQLDFNLSSLMDKIPALLVDATCQESAIDHQRLPGDERGCIGGQKHCCTRNFVDSTETSHRRAHQQLVTALSAVQQCGIQFCAENARSDGIHQHAMFRPFDRQRTRQGNDRRFTGGVGSDLRQGNKTIERSDIYNATGIFAPACTCQKSDKIARCRSGWCPEYRSIRLPKMSVSARGESLRRS